MDIRILDLIPKKLYFSKHLNIVSLIKDRNFNVELNFQMEFKETFKYKITYSNVINCYGDSLSESLLNLFYFLIKNKILILDNIIEDIKDCFSKEDFKKYWIAYCSECGYINLSKNCFGGESIADTGDYSDVTCPICGKIVESLD